MFLHWNPSHHQECLEIQIRQKVIGPKTKKKKKKDKSELFSQSHPDKVSTESP